MAPKRKYKVVVSSVANDDLATHLHFLARVSGKAARQLKTALLKDMRSLEEMPERHPSYDRPFLERGKYRYMLSAGRYRIVYLIMNDTVYIDGIEDCRQGQDDSGFDDT